MVDRNKIQVDLIKLVGGERLLRLTEPQSGLCLEQKLDPQKPVARQKEKLFGVFDAALARAELFGGVKASFHYPRGVLAKYAHTVTSASLGAVTDAELEQEIRRNLDARNIQVVLATDARPNASGLSKPSKKRQKKHLPFAHRGRDSASS